jgi:hypothetical protein
MVSYGTSMHLEKEKHRTKESFECHPYIHPEWGHYWVLLVHCGA